MDSIKNNSDRKYAFDLSSATLHILAMLFMLIDHSMKTVIENDSWIFIIGRLAFPIFAFMAAEGYFYTHNYRKYITRMLIFAVISEIPYDLMKSGLIVDLYDQNVMWTFLLALLCIRVIDLAKTNLKKWQYILISIAVLLVGIILGMVLMVDYGGFGVLTVLIFYFFHDRKWWCMLLQFILLLIINMCFLGMGYGVTLTAFGTQIEIPLQGFAVLALIPIWMYHGRQGYHSKPFKYICYAFYPVHMLILFTISKFI